MRKIAIFFFFWYTNKAHKQTVQTQQKQSKNKNKTKKNTTDSNVTLQDITIEDNLNVNVSIICYAENSCANLKINAGNQTMLQKSYLHIQCMNIKSCFNLKINGNYSFHIIINSFYTQFSNISLYQSRNLAMRYDIMCLCLICFFDNAFY